MLLKVNGSALTAHENDMSTRLRLRDPQSASITNISVVKFR